MRITKLSKKKKLRIQFCTFEDSQTRRCVKPPVSLSYKINNKPSDFFTPQPKVPDIICGYDISHLCNLGENQIQISSLSIGWGFYSHLSFAVRLARYNSIEELTNKKINSSKISYENSLKNVQESFKNDNEIEQVSLKVSLRCPLSLMRIKNPVRGDECQHIECFDLGSYLSVNQNHPSFECPICSSPVMFDDIIVDSYFAKILNEVTDDEVDEVIILPNGNYTIVEPKKEVDSSEEKK